MVSTLRYNKSTVKNHLSMAMVWKNMLLRGDAVGAGRGLTQ